MADEPQDDLAFLNLILILGTMAAQRLDAVAAGGPEQQAETLPRARESITMLSQLKVRTKDRLGPQETIVLNSVLRDLQGRYVKAIGMEPKAG